MPYFYKYVTPTTGLIVLRNHTLRWGTPSTLNDPFDMQFGFQLRYDRASVVAKAVEKQWQHLVGELEDRPVNRLGVQIRAMREQGREHDRGWFEERSKIGVNDSLNEMERLLDQLSDHIRENVSTHKILCVSVEPDNIPMWSYYAANHTGFVLRFNSDVEQSPLSRAVEVNYVSQVPSIFDEEFMADFLAGYGELDRSIMLKLAIYTKYSSWAHEKEWRVDTGQGRTNDPFEDTLFNPQELDGVVVGVRSTQADRDAVKSILADEYPHADLLRASAVNNEYRLRIDPYT